MVDKRSLRSSKKDSQETPAEQDKPKPTRTRSTRSKKGSGKNQETTAAGDEEAAAPTQTPSVTQSEDIVMETESEAAPDKPNEDVEMKNATEDVKEEKKDDVPTVKEDPPPSPLTGVAFCCCF